MQKRKRPPHDDAKHGARVDRMLVIGVGNEYRSDDGLGLYVVRELGRRVNSGVSMIELSGEGTALMSTWKNAGQVLVIDAVISGGPAGVLHRVDATREKLSRRIFHSSSHTFGVCEAIELSRQLNELPESLILYGLEAESFEAGIGLSESVVRTVPDLLHVIECDMERLRGLKCR